VAVSFIGGGNRSTRRKPPALQTGHLDSHLFQNKDVYKCGRNEIINGTMISAIILNSLYVNVINNGGLFVYV
jgi:hypothetical protein